MLSEIYSGVESWQLVTLIVSAILIGINKTAIPGLGVLPVILLTLAFESRFSVGLQLGMLVLADLIAVSWYRRKADWRIIFRLLPWAWAGLGVGSLILWLLPEGNERLMRMLVGGIVLGLVILNFIRSRVAPDKIPSGIAAGGFFGTLLGITTQLANAAGPVAAIYFLAMKLPKEKYMGCNAWFFMIINWSKLPIFALQGRMSLESVKMDLTMIPFLLLGGAIGILLLSKMPQKVFENVTQVIVVLCALKLFF